MSIKEIAALVGVSPATVSRVLNNPSYRCSSPEVRDKIWRTAIEQNYVPNEAARNLKKGIYVKNDKTFYINVLMTRMDESQSDPFFTEILKVVESEIHENICILSKVWYMPAFSSDRECSAANFDRMIKDMLGEVKGRGDGLIIIGKCNAEALKIFNERYRGVVSINRNSTNYKTDEVLCDGKKIVSLAMEHLISLGHQDIGYVGECQNEARYEGYLTTLQKHGIKFNPAYVFETKQTEMEGFECMSKLMHMKNRPTGIYCANDITAIGMIKCMNVHKNVYYHPSIISSDDIEQAQNMSPMLTTVRLPKEEMGKFAILLLLDRLRGKHKSIIRMELEGKLMVRESCSPLQEHFWCDYCI
ncbi:MAG: LacI family transcriptional regulator [Clostridiales bacterium]|nr:LacI family transcriptional regulator [Clostridiales bacterium]